MRLHSLVSLALTTSAITLAVVCLLPAAVEGHGGFDERIEVANRAVAARPTDLQPRLALAELHRRHGDLVAAMRDLDDASHIAPEHRRIDYFRGLVHLDAGRYLEAEALLRRFLDQQPGPHPAGHEARARALLKLERPLDAAREYDVAIEQQPVPIPDYYHERALALAAAGDAHLEEAIRGIDEGIAAIGPIVTLESVAIDLEVRRGSIDAALLRLERIADRSPRRERWLAQRGGILAETGRTVEAEQSFARALLELEGLSDQRRRTPAMSRLEAEIRESMAELAGSQPRSTP
ncbi:MAG: tetratricopeptide repeat protein [Myxococcota bacterium]|nr:tetratricopeptide repeat protein [Myxococcota bacterium]